MVCSHVCEMGMEVDSDGKEYAGKELLCSFMEVLNVHWETSLGWVGMGTHSSWSEAGDSE